MTTGTKRATSLLDFKSVQEARTQLARAQADLLAVEAQIRHMQALARPEDGGAVARAAKRYLDGEDVPQSPRFDEQEFGVLQERRRMLAAAVELARREVAAAESAASRAICEALLPEYAEHVRRVADAMVGVVRAHEAMLELTESLSEAGISWSGVLRPMQMGALGRASDRYSLPAQWLREAVKYSLLDPGFDEEVVSWK